MNRIEIVTNNLHNIMVYLSCRLEVGIRPKTTDKYMPRYWVSINNLYIQTPTCLVGVYGNGDTIDEAVIDYHNKIFGKDLEYNYYGRDIHKFIFMGGVRQND